MVLNQCFSEASAVLHEIDLQEDKTPLYHHRALRSRYSATVLDNEKGKWLHYPAFEMRLLSNQSITAGHNGRMICVWIETNDGYVCQFTRGQSSISRKKGNSKQSKRKVELVS